VSLSDARVMHNRRDPAHTANLIRSPRLEHQPHTGPYSPVQSQRIRQTGAVYGAVRGNPGRKCDAARR
jgi:hypothetical protein